MSDIVERLQERAKGVTWHWANSEEMAKEAADEIERLRSALLSGVSACVPGTLTRLELERIAKEALGDE